MSLIDRLRQRRRDATHLKNLFESAEQFAIDRGDERAGAQHLMLAALNLDDDSTAQMAFTTVGADWQLFDSAITAQQAEALQGLGLPAELAADGPPLPRPRFLQVDATFEAAIQATYHAHEGDGALCGAHVVIGVCSVEHGVAARALESMGINRSELRDAALAAAKAR